MNTFTFTDDEVVVIRNSLIKHSDEIISTLTKADQMGFNASAIGGLSRIIPITKDCLEKLNRPKGK